MRVFAISDIHLERRELQEVPPTSGSFDVLVCAGDVWEGQPEKSIQSVVNLAKGRPAIIVLGNHDYYGGSDRRVMSDVLRRMNDEADYQNALVGAEIVTVLSANNPVHEIEQTRFIGLTLWSDWALAGRWMGASNDIKWASQARLQARHVKSGPREYGEIRTEKGPWTPYDAIAEHARERAILLDELVSSHDGPTVVVTHHPPLAECVDAYEDLTVPRWAPAFYASDLLRTLPRQFQPNLWVCGHVHAQFDGQFGQTRVICNPVEGRQFNPNLVIEI